MRAVSASPSLKSPLWSTASSENSSPWWRVSGALRKLGMVKGAPGNGRTLLLMISSLISRSNNVNS